ncbi:MAG: lysophospholipid acyltransferase family protein [Longimicrobiales bacterium]|nr:lysophospholipid acyltransferase family protein [Longimicrobiales bacterium]
MRRTLIGVLNLLRVIPTAILSTIWYGIRVVYAARTSDGERDPRLVELPRAWGHSLLRGAGVRVEVEGAEHLVEPAVLVCNHVSWYDTFAVLTHLPVDTRFVGKREIVRIPFFGPAWLAAGHIPIDRRDRRSAIESLRHAGEALRRDGGVIVMFPEGTRSRDGALQPFKKGAFMLALQIGVPIIPVAVVGSREIMRKGSILVHPGTMRLRIGEPIPVTEMTEDDRDVLVATARSRVAALLGHPITLEGREV